MQMRKTGSSHKRNSCKYHDVTLAKEGVMIKSMIQVTLIYRVSQKKICTHFIGRHADGQKKQDNTTG